MLQTNNWEKTFFQHNTDYLSKKGNPIVLKYIECALDPLDLAKRETPEPLPKLQCFS